MQLNTARIELVAQPNGSFIVKARLRGEDRDDQCWMNRAEMEMLLHCLQGDADVFPFFDDNIHLLKAAPSGLTFLHLDGGKNYVRHTHTLPGKDLAQYVEAILNAQDGVETTIELGCDRMQAWQEQYGPKIDVDWVISSERDTYALYRAAIETHPELQEQVNLLKQMARQYSDGDLVVLHVSIDSMPDASSGKPADFYWWIEKDGQRVYNGGIIAHQRDGGFQYSTHT